MSLFVLVPVLMIIIIYTHATGTTTVANATTIIDILSMFTIVTMRMTRDHDHRCWSIHPYEFADLPERVF